MSFTGGMGSAFGPSSALRFAQTRGRIQGSPMQGVGYPSPFFDVAHTYMPATVKALFKWCRYYFLTNPLINATVFKLSEYPVTDIIIDHPNKQVANRWTEYFQDHLRYRSFQVECGLDYHCFHGDVKAVTKDGVFRLRDLVGQTAHVLSQDGVYRPAKFIESISKQELLEVEFRDGSTVLVTPEHQWPVLTSSGKIIKVPTTELEGRSVPRNVAARPEQDDDFYEGVRHGFVFGDGTLYNDGKQSRACFFGSKDQPMVHYFEGHGSPPYRESRGHVFIHGLPPHYKKLPENSASASYWYGFLSGFLAADGSVDVAGCVVLTQRGKATLEAIAEQLPRLGMIAGRVRGYEESTAYGDGTTYVLSLFKQYMRPQDFLLPHHRKNFEDNYKETAYGKLATVRTVRETGLFEKVYCCLEEETHTFTIDNGILTGNTYGNTLVSLGFPFHKSLYCQSCDFSEAAHRIRDKWVFTNYGFRLTCPRCGETGEALARDFYFRNASGIKLIRWNAEDVDITYNDLTGEYTHFYTVPPSIRNDIVVGKKDVVESIPQIYLQALREQKGIIFAKSNLFHMKRPGLATLDRGWGTPLLLPVLKDTFYLQIMKKAQEAILLEHVVPLRVLFPQAGSGTSDPYTTINLVDWRDHVAQEIARWRYDSNYIPILPLPIGNQTIGGDGKALLLTQEIQTWSEQIMVGMGVPREFLLGGMSYAGTNVSMRMLENAFLGYCLRHKALVRFAMQSIAWYMGWPEVKIRFKPFKMADDLQRKAYRFQMNAAGKMSDTTLLADDDLDQEEENQIMIQESDTRIEATKKQQLALAQIQGEASLIMAKFQAKAQQTMMSAQAAPVAPGEPGGPEALAGGAPGGAELEPQLAPSGMQEGGQPAQALPPGAADQMQSQLSTSQQMQLPGGQASMNVDLPSMAGAQARLISHMNPGMQALAVSNLRAQSPDLADLVVQILSTMGITVQENAAQAGQPMMGQPAGQAAGPQVDMRPLPEQRSPRRDTQLI